MAKAAGKLLLPRPTEERASRWLYGHDPRCPTAADALDAAENGCPERAQRGLRNRAGVP